MLNATTYNPMKLAQEVQGIVSRGTLRKYYRAARSGKWYPNLLKATGRRLPRWVRPLIADRGYSSDPFRAEVCWRRVEPIIPYPKNRHKGEKGLLWLDRRSFYSVEQTCSIETHSNAFVVTEFESLI